MKKQQSLEIAEFNRERNEAFLSLDEQKIRIHQRKWNGKEMSNDMRIFWASVHKAITGVQSLPTEFRKQSKAWLDARSLKSLDYGEL
jgi:hypothetical protein